MPGLLIFRLFTIQTGYKLSVITENNSHLFLLYFRWFIHVIHKKTDTNSVKVIKNEKTGLCILNYTYSTNKNYTN